MAGPLLQLLLTSRLCVAAEQSPLRDGLTAVCLSASNVSLDGASEKEKDRRHYELEGSLLGVCELEKGSGFSVCRGGKVDMAEWEKIGFLVSQDELFSKQNSVKKWTTDRKRKSRVR
jgi:hypothetical protein